jgi:flagellar basal-body rod protein FlgG
MDVGLYIAAQGMLTQQVRQDQLSNDLANAGTAGYKSDNSTQHSFGALLLSNTQTGQAVGGIQTGVGISSIQTNFSPAPLKQTGQPLDFGISGQGFFAVQTAQGVRFTRDGQFSSSAQGQLVDSQGNQVLSQTGAPIAVSRQGTVQATALGVFNVPNAAKQGDNFYSGNATGRANGVVQQGALEGSSVDAVQTMTDMMSSLRSYEAGQKAIQTIDETLQRSSQSVGALGGN